MEQDLKCTNCGGDKFKFVANGTYKCAYCGQIHNMPHMNPQAAAPQASNINYADRKNRVTAAILALLLGALGAHKFYLKQAGMGVLFLLFFWTYIPGIIGFIEGIILLTMSDEAFDQKYNA